MNVTLSEPHYFVDADYPAGTVAETATPEEAAAGLVRLQAACVDGEGMTLVRLGGKLRWVEPKAESPEALSGLPVAR